MNLIFKSVAVIALLSLFSCSYNSIAQQSLAQESFDKHRIEASMIKALEWQEAQLFVYREDF